MEKFRWAYIGSGSIAEQTSSEIIASGRHEVVTVYSRRFEKATEFADSVGAIPCRTIKEAVERKDVDAVYIATVHPVHFEEAMEIIGYKKPILCEKPLTMNAKDTKTLIDAARENEVFLAEAMWTWFSPYTLKIKDIILSGELGDFTEADFYYALPSIKFFKTPRHTDPKLGAGAILDVGIYPITYAYRLFGKPDKITCVGDVRDGVDYSEKVVLEYNGGLKCNMSISIEKLDGIERIEIKGSKASITVPWFHCGRGDADIKYSFFKHKKVKGDINYVYEFDSIAEDIREGKLESTKVPLKATYEVMEILDECRRQMGHYYPCEK